MRKGTSLGPAPAGQRSENLPVDKIRRCGRVGPDTARGVRGWPTTSGRRGCAQGGWRAADYAANFADLHPALRRARGAGGRRPLLFLPRRALHRRPVRPRSTFRCSSARSRPASRWRRRQGRSSAQNILGGMCARVCPTETLCEEACVREAAEGKPVEIGRLQRYATDRGDGGGRASLHPRRADRQAGGGGRRRAGGAGLRASAGDEGARGVHATTPGPSRAG